MKAVLSIVTVAILATIAGCTGNTKAVVKASESTRQDIFRPVSESIATSGKAMLKIVFPVKSFKSRIMDTYIKHSDPPYTVTINIDGQSVVLTDEPVLEELPGDFKENPEVGTGWKYSFRKTLLLEPGKHHVTIAVPLADVVAEKEVTLTTGMNQLQVAPIYNSPVSRYPNFPRFSRGVRNMSLTLNNQLL